MTESRPPIVVLSRLLLSAGLAVCVASAAQAQARSGLPVRLDPTGALSAIRAIDYRQLCRCSTVLVDSVVRVAPGLQVFGVLGQPVASVLTPGDVARLKLARHRAVRAGFEILPKGSKGNVSVIAQVVGDPRSSPERRVAVVATPPNGIMATYLTRMTVRRGAWRVFDVRTVLEP